MSSLLRRHDSITPLIVTQVRSYYIAIAQVGSEWKWKAQRGSESFYYLEFVNQILTYYCCVLLFVLCCVTNQVICSVLVPRTGHPPVLLLVIPFMFAARRVGGPAATALPPPPAAPTSDDATIVMFGMARPTHDLHCLLSGSVTVATQKGASRHVASALLPRNTTKYLTAPLLQPLVSLKVSHNVAVPPAWEPFTGGFMGDLQPPYKVPS